MGPCAAESREQVVETASRLVTVIGDRLAVSGLIFRAGVWKPRTRPDTFQGAGEEGLAWLQEIKERFGIPVATEVATPDHVREALFAGIDYLWIGARTSANPIAVQAIADTIRQTTRTPKGILIKNPVNADAGLWLGNITRLEATGVPVIAVHRGCNHQPCWAMAHQVRLARPDIPMLLDPSHMSGDAAKVPVLMEKVRELGLDGAMVEVHNNPAEALSDKAQQVKPEDLSEFIGNNPNQSESIGEGIELNWLRAEIDELDETLWDTIAARMEVSKRIGEWKKAHGVAPLQPERYQTIVERINELTNERGLSTDFALHVWELIHKESLKAQE